jgi:hypothetical protein
MKLKNLLFITICCPHVSHAVIVTNLAVNVSAKVFDRAYGTLYLGLAGSNNNAITAFYRFDGVGSPTSSAIATNPNLSNATIEFLALSEQGCSATSVLATATVAATGAFSQTDVMALTSDGAHVGTSSQLNDASGAAITSGIVGLAASAGYVFAAVRPSGGDFGAVNSGIALMKLTPVAATLDVLDATTGAAGNKAQRFDINSTVLGFTPPVTFDGTANENLQLFYDSFLDRLYIATLVSSGNGGARSTAVAYVDSNGILQIKSIGNATAFDNTNTQIVGTKANAALVYNYQVSVLHASTGPSYLIVNGNADPGTNGRNSIYALPLVDNSSVPATHGTLANKNSALTDGKFTIAATSADQLVTTTDVPAKVGTSPLPLPLTNLPWEIVVVGDTVYASIDDPASATADPGIFYSQALFDENGKIARWTPWSKRATPFDSFPDGTATHYPQITFFDVDAMNGKLWAVNTEGTTPGKKLITTAWDLGTTSTSLAGKLNSAMATGCYSLLDLDQSTRGLGTSSPARFALFGGVNQVIFARTSHSTSLAAPYDYAAGTNIPYPQTVTTNFSGAADFLISPLPSDAGAVVALEYSRRETVEGAQNYFFAGAQGGLYVFADATGAGFTINNTVDGLNAAPFAQGEWYLIDPDKLKGSVIALKTTGQGTFGALYILTLEVTTGTNPPLISRLYSIPFGPNVTYMETNRRLLAQSQVAATNSDLSSALIIMGMQNITTNSEQLVIATNNGLYHSTATESGVGNYGIITAANQTAAAWIPVDSTDTTLYTGIFGIDNTLYQSTIWPVQIADEAGYKTFDRGTIRQLSGTVTANGYTFMPDPFNSSNPTASNATTLPQISSLWSDGNRRFFIVKRNGDTFGGNRLMVFPYDQDEWCASTLYLLDPVLNTICSCNCIKQIGATGILMVGTNSGVVALE